jgi:hypothetical protein
MPINIFQGPSSKLSGRGKPKKLAPILPDGEGSDSSSDGELDVLTPTDKLPIDLTKPIKDEGEGNRVSFLLYLLTDILILAVVLLLRKRRQNVVMRILPPRSLLQPMCHARDRRIAIHEARHPLPLPRVPQTMG